MGRLADTFSSLKTRSARRQVRRWLAAKGIILVVMSLMMVIAWMVAERCGFGGGRASAERHREAACFRKIRIPEIPRFGAYAPSRAHARSGLWRFSTAEGQFSLVYQWRPRAFSMRTRKFLVFAHK